MMAAIVEWGTIGKVVLYSLVAGVGISVIFGLGVSSAAGLMDAMRARRGTAAIGWGVLAGLCIAGSLGAVVLGIVVMTTK